MSLNRINLIFDNLKSEFVNKWQASYMDLRDYIEPTRGGFDGDQDARGQGINHQKVLDGYASMANEILASGLMSGMTSPTRPWFKLILDEDFFNEDPLVREWLDDTEKRIRTVLSQSNIYQTLYSAYREIGAFGTSCFMVLEDAEDVVRGYSFTVGEYYIGTDNRGRVNRLGREYYMTVDQLVLEFGIDNVSGSTRQDYNSNNRQSSKKIRHLIDENDNKIPGFDLPFRSAYWEVGNETGFLAKRGFNRFPILAPRWETVTTSQVYGKGPGWKAIGDVKQLQKSTDDKLKLQEKLHNPPVTMDSDIEGFASLVPGGVTRSSFNVPDAGIKPTYQVPDALNSFIEMNAHLKENIDKFFFVNLFLMLINVDTKNMTATEVAERQQEKIMMMGPILHRLQEELLDPLIDIIFGVMLENGMLQPPPEVLQGQELRVKYISVLAQAQEALGVNQIKSLMDTVLTLSQARPDILDNFDFDELARQLNEMENAPAKILMDDNDVAEIREQRAQAQQMQQMAEVAKSGGAGVKDLVEANEIATSTQ